MDATNYSPALIYVGTGISLAILVLPGLAMGVTLWWRDRHRGGTLHPLPGAEDRHESLKRAA